MEMEETNELRFWKFLIKEIPKIPEHKYLMERAIQLLTENEYKLSKLVEYDQLNLIVSLFEEY